MAYITDAAREYNYKREYQQYLSLMQNAAKIIQQYDNGDKTRNEATDMLRDIFDKIERDFTGPHSMPTISTISHVLHHDYEIDDPRITLSYDDFIDVSREYTKQRSKEALKPREETTIEAINKALNILSNEYELYIGSDDRYPGYTDILADMSKAIEILKKYKR